MMRLIFNVVKIISINLVFTSVLHYIKINSSINNVIFDCFLSLLVCIIVIFTSISGIDDRCCCDCKKKLRPTITEFLKELFINKTLFVERDFELEYNEEKNTLIANYYCEKCYQKVKAIKLADKLSQM